MPLNPTDLATLSRLLDEAFDLEPEAVDRWLAELPAEHKHLQDRLAQMLKAHRAQSNPNFMADGPKFGSVDETVASTGELVGPYRLIREIGRGGMGAVWLAERADGTLKRYIALKLPRLAWGAGLAERMARERDIGALLEHPNIARLYDAGVDSKGRPYLALEYIDGQPLDAWCESQALSIRDRLKLFVQVARAVAYAHGRLVVHRDLKPSNVLVTADGQAHLLDFGIAKLLHEAAADDAQLTQEQGRVLTPHYASPEQIKGETITVASDVYSLGVLLYELLTTRYPYEPEGKSLAAIEAAIVRDEPPPASSQAQDKSVAKSLRGEIDAILSKALKREPSERYSSADAVANDVDRFLCGEPISARRDSQLYRLRKTLRRHWVSFAAATSVLVAVMAGSAVAVFETQQAAQAAHREKVVKEFVLDVFRLNGGAKHSGDSPFKKMASSNGLLEGGVALIQHRFSGQPELQAELFGAVGGVFSDMGAYQTAADYFSKRSEALAALHPDPVEQAKALLELGQALFDDRKFGEAAPYVKEAIQLAGAGTSAGLAALVLQARVQYEQAQYEASAATLREVDLRLRDRGETSASAAAWSQFLHAQLLVIGNQMDMALPMYARAIDSALAAEGPLSETAISIRLNLARWLSGTENVAEAEASFKAARSALIELGGAHEVRAFYATAYFAATQYLYGGQISAVKAIATLQQSRADLDASPLPIPSWFLPQVDFWTGRVKSGFGDVSGGLSLLESSAPQLLRAFVSPVEQASIYRSLGNGLMGAGRHELAASYLQKELELRGPTGDGKHPYAVVSYELIAMNRIMQGKALEAEPVLDKAPIFEPFRGDKDPLSFQRRMVLARARIRYAIGDSAGALNLLGTASWPLSSLKSDYGEFLGEVLCAGTNRKEGLALLKGREAVLTASDDSPDSPWLARVRALEGLCAFADGDRRTASGMAKRARASILTQPELSSYYKEPLVKLELALAIGHRPVSQRTQKGK